MCDCWWHYKDSSFPPDIRSLGDVGGDDANKKSGKTNADVIWRRAGDFTHSGRMQLFADTVDPKDICQGALGDCWLLAAMACMAEHEGAIHSLFYTRERNPRGKYKVRIFDGFLNKWVTITVDDFVPCSKQVYERDKTCQPLFTQPNGNELWVMILEKAFAKFCGSYHNLEGGSSLWAIRAMTGDHAREFRKGTDGWQRLDLENNESANRRDYSLYARGEKLDNNTMFRVLHKYDKLHSVLAISGSDGVNGLVKGHAYSILRVEEAKGFRLVQIRNPWGTGEWKGDWSDSSSKWTEHPAVAKAVGYVNKDDGAFWMSWDDVVQHWTSINVVDRSVDMHTLKLEVADDSMCAPTKGCLRGCFKFWFCCYGPHRLYCPHRSSEETVKVDQSCLSWLCCGLV